jgi:hypothetical protein
VSDAYSRASSQGGSRTQFEQDEIKVFFLRKRLARFQTVRIMRHLGKGKPLPLSQS